MVCVWYAWGLYAVRMWSVSLDACPMTPSHARRHRSQIMYGSRASKKFVVPNSHIYQYTKFHRLQKITQTSISRRWTVTYGPHARKLLCRGLSEITRADSVLFVWISVWPHFRRWGRTRHHIIYMWMRNIGDYRWFKHARSESWYVPWNWNLINIKTIYRQIRGW